MSDNVIQGIALSLMLGSMPLISFGAWNDIDVLWWVGLALLAIGGLIPPVNRYVNPDDTEGADGGHDDEVRADS